MISYLKLPTTVPPVGVPAPQPFLAGHLYQVSVHVAAASVRHYARVLIFTLYRSSAELLWDWWPQVSTLCEREIYFDDAPNVTPAYLQTCIRHYGPVNLVLIEGWDMLLLDTGVLPARADPHLLEALRRLARQMKVPVVTWSVAAALGESPDA